jgi:peptidoglycan hydrolase CwlO-like protein
MKEPQRIKLNPETPVAKQVIKYKLPPLDKPEWNISNIENSDTYIESDLDKINNQLDTIYNEDYSKND